MIPLWNTKLSAGTGNAEDDFQPYMTPYLLPGDEVRGAVLVFPGGGYACRVDHEARPIAEAFNAEGFHAFVVQYRVAPHYYPCPMADAYRAIRIVRANADKWHSAPENIATCGLSAGGHLALFTGVGFDRSECLPPAGGAGDNVSARPDAVIGGYPVSRLDETVGHPGSGKNLLGEKYQTDHPQFDPAGLVREDMPPYFLWHTAEDQVVPVGGTLDLARAIWQKKRTCELHVFPHGPHGIALAPDYPDAKIWMQQAATFLKKAGFKSVK